MDVMHNRNPAPVRLCNANCNHPKGMRGEGLNDKLWIMEGSPSLDTFEAYVGEGFRNLAEGSKAGLQKVGIFSYIMKVLHEVLHDEGAASSTSSLTSTHLPSPPSTRRPSCRAITFCPP